MAGRRVIALRCHIGRGVGKAIQRHPTNVGVSRQPVRAVIFYGHRVAHDGRNIMASSRFALALLAATALVSCNKVDTPPTPKANETAAAVDTSDPITSAESAAPAAVSKAASIVTMGADGTM